MFGKLMKYNLKFGQNTFLGMAAIMVLASIFLKIMASNVFRDMGLTALISLVMIPVAVVCVVLVFQNFSKSLFANQGYFTLALPVKKSSIVSAQLLTALIWFLFMVFVTFISIAILSGFNTMRIVLADLFTSNNIVFFILVFISLIIYVSYTILVVFMGITLSNVSISGKRIHGGVAAIGVFIFLTIATLLENLFTKILGEKVLYLIYNAENIFLKMNFISKVGEESGIIFSIDMISFVWTIILAIATYFITVYLLKKRIDLK